MSIVENKMAYRIYSFNYLDEISIVGSCVGSLAEVYDAPLNISFILKQKLAQHSVCNIDWQGEREVYLYHKETNRKYIANTRNPNNRM